MKTEKTAAERREELATLLFCQSYLYYHDMLSSAEDFTYEEATGCLDAPPNPHHRNQVRAVVYRGGSEGMGKPRAVCTHWELRKMLAGASGRYPRP